MARCDVAQWHSPARNTRGLWVRAPEGWYHGQQSRNRHPICICIMHVFANLVSAPCPVEPAVPGAASLALSALRLTTLANTQGGASQRPSALADPMFCVLLCREG